MLRVVSFAGAVISGGCVYLTLLLTPQSDAPLSNRLPGEVLLRMKVNTAAHAGRADLGLFGNSRSLMVGGQHLGPAGRSFYNFSVAGGSFRNSVGMLELLTAQRTAPHVAIISLDHFEIGMMGPPEYLPLGYSLRLAAADVTATRDSPREMLRVSWRHAYTLWRRFKSLLSTSYFVAVGQRLTGSHAVNGAEYRSDGSRVLQQLAEHTHPSDFAPASKDEIIDRLLERDLARLRKILDGPDGPVRIVVYESPLDPKHALRYSEAPTPLARMHRELTRTICLRLRLECELGGAPDLIVSAPEPWPDATHAPGSVLGRYVAVLAERRISDAGAAQ